MNLSKIDKFLISFFTIILIISCWFVVFTKPSTEILPDREPIGTISYLENNVKKRNSINQNWFDTYVNDSFVLNDFIFNGDDSTALLDFYNGNRIVVSKNSLIHINDNKNKLTLSVDNGNIQAKSQQEMHVSIVGKKEFVVANQTEFKLDHQKNKIEIEVYKGDLQLETPSKKIKLNDGDSVHINDGQTVVEKSKLRIDIAYILDNKLFLHWVSEYHESPFEIRVSETIDFSKASKLTSVLENHEMPWRAKQAFVMVVTKDKNGREVSSSVRQIFNQFSTASDNEITQEMTKEIPAEKKSILSKIQEYIGKIINNNSKDKVIDKMVKKNIETDKEGK